MKKIFKIIKNRFIAYLLVFKNLRGTSAKILSRTDTVKHVLKSKKSIIRLGDGEFAFFLGKGISYQEYDKEIQKYLLKIVNEYSKESNYILCIPKYFFECNGIKLLKKSSYVLAWSKPREYFKKHFKKQVEYGDAFLFASGKEKEYDLVFRNDEVENVIFVHNSEKYAKAFEKKYHKNVKFIKVPTKNSFTVINKIEKEIEEEIKEKKDKWIVLVSAGPMAKVLVYRISKKGIWAIDTGHCWDKPLHEGDAKNGKNKYNNTSV